MRGRGGVSRRGCTGEEGEERSGCMSEGRRSCIGEGKKIRKPNPAGDYIQALSYCQCFQTNQIIDQLGDATLGFLTCCASFDIKKRKLSKDVINS